MGKTKDVDDLSPNPNTVRERNRIANLSEERKQWERRKKADSQIITRALERLEQTDAYINADKDLKRTLVDAEEDRVVKKL
jgi:hypothetical protein